MKNPKILVIGACGLLGTPLTQALRQQYGTPSVIAADRLLSGPAPYARVDALNTGEIAHLVNSEKITQIYLLVNAPELSEHEAWKLHMDSLLSVLRIAAAQRLDKVFWPSSAAPDIAKRAGEQWCAHYAQKEGLDVRSLRLPALGGYPAEMLRAAAETGSYRCYLKEDTCLPFMPLSEAVRGIMQFMAAPKVNILYDLSSLTFAPCDLAAAIRRHQPEFHISYQPDHRQVAAGQAALLIDDTRARRDWNWQPAGTLRDYVAAQFQTA